MRDNPYDPSQLTVSGLVDYCTCPLLYMFRHVRGKEDVRPARAYQDALRDAAHYLFRAVQSQHYPIASEMKRVWQVVWHQKAAKRGVPKEFLRQQNRPGLEVLVNMQQFFRGNPGTPILVDRAYTIDIGGLRLTGAVDLVRECRGDVEIFAMDPGVRRQDRIQAVFDPGLTAAAVAVEQLLGQPAARMYTYFIRQARIAEYRFTAQSGANLRAVAHRVRRAITGEIYHPRLYSDECLECPFWHPCSAGDWFPKEG